MISFNNSCDGFYKDSLDVRFTKRCDNACPFCIERNGIKGERTDVNRLIMETIKTGKKEILILGGEPLLLPHVLLLYVRGIRSFVDHIYVTTSLPKTVEDNWNTFTKIMGYIDGLNISLQHYDPEKNNNILHASSRHDRITLTKRICNAYADKVRVSINLIKGQIDTKEEIDTFLKKMEECGVQHVKINELQFEKDLYVSFEKAYGVKYKSPFAYGCQTQLQLPGHPLLITLKRSCFLVNPMLRASAADFVKSLRLLTKNKSNEQVVLYENGVCSKGWKLENRT